MRLVSRAGAGEHPEVYIYFSDIYVAEMPLRHQTWLALCSCCVLKSKIEASVDEEHQVCALTMSKSVQSDSCRIKQYNEIASQRIKHQLPSGKHHTPTNSLRSMYFAVLCVSASVHCLQQESGPKAKRWGDALKRLILQDDFASDIGFQLVAELNDQLVGVVLAWHLPSAQELQLLQIATDPSFRRQGIASQLLHQIQSDHRCAATLDAYVLHHSVSMCRVVWVRPCCQAVLARPGTVLDCGNCLLFTLDAKRVFRAPPERPGHAQASSLARSPLIEHQPSLNRDRTTVC